MTQLLTHSRQQSFKSCRKAHYYSYELGLRPRYSAGALRMGSAFHEGVEALGNGKHVHDAVQAVYGMYDDCPGHFDRQEWDYERETVARLVCAYEWRWRTMPLEYLAVELPFELPLLNPETGKATPSWNLAGKIDAIVKLEDGRIAVKETKLFGDDISHDSDLWRRMRMDTQVSLYLHAARRLGFDAQTVLYDVARKPTIGPTAVPILDELGVKIVLDKSGDRVKTDKKQWRQTGDKERGYVLQARAMTSDEWGEKLTTDVCERPEFYFSRVEIPRLDQDLAEFQNELWDIQRTMREAQLSGRHYRTVNKMTCSYCPYFGLCSNGTVLSGTAPEGFEFVSEKHPELQVREKVYDNSSTPAAESAASTAPATEREAACV